MSQLIQRYPNLCTAVRSVTTRSSRGPEDERWYRFVTRQEIESMDLENALGDFEFRQERYVLFRSEIERALARAPIACMAIVPSVIYTLREHGIPHALINFKIGDAERYTARLQQRGYAGEKLVQEVQASLHFNYPLTDPRYPQRDLYLGQSDKQDDQDFVAAVHELAGPVFPEIFV